MVVSLRSSAIILRLSVTEISFLERPSAISLALVVVRFLPLKVLGCSVLN